MSKVKITGIEIESSADIKSINIEVNYAESNTQVIHVSDEESPKKPQVKSNAPFQSVY